MAEGSLLAAAIRVPENVVFRDFGEETVMLNLDTGMYHGLNGTAAAMLEQAAAATSMGAAVSPLAQMLDTDETTVADDLAGLCAQLRERGLIEIVGGAP